MKKVSRNLVNLQTSEEQQKFVKTKWSFLLSEFFPSKNHVENYSCIWCQKFLNIIFALCTLSAPLESNTTFVPFLQWISSWSSCFENVMNFIFAFFEPRYVFSWPLFKKFLARHLHFFQLLEVHFFSCQFVVEAKKV